MNRYFCDKCGEEIKGLPVFLTIDDRTQHEDSDSYEHFELCPKCANEISELLGGNANFRGD